MVIINVKTVKKSAATLKLKTCDHLEKDRMLEGTWATEEVKLAVRNGYKARKIFSEWHWNAYE
jgi:hypothetical protein